ncbi:PTS glucose/sucrose transporter subunit IIB, partial [Winkia sp. UMB3105]|uniref:PTS glucose/sucrose transporter subunit IIB n=1 Tax=Winkia sp. UMB3105 TaxID=3046332 RepID=UPI0025555610
EEHLAKNIFEQIGGKQNTNKIYNCMTRIRIDIKDFQAVNLSALEEVEGVLGLVKDGNTLQIVVGPGTSQKVADKMNEL